MSLYLAISVASLSDTSLGGSIETMGQYGKLLSAFITGKDIPGALRSYIRAIEQLMESEYPPQGEVLDLVVSVHRALQIPNPRVASQKIDEALMAYEKERVDSP